MARVRLCVTCTKPLPPGSGRRLRHPECGGNPVKAVPSASFAPSSAPFAPATPTERPQVPAHGPIVAALTEALASLPLEPQDAPTVALARRLAFDIDMGEPLGELAPKLLAALTALGMSPAARAALTKGGASSGAGTSSGLADFRARARMRIAATRD